MPNTNFKIKLYTGQSEPIDFVLETRSLMAAVRVFPKILKSFDGGEWTRTPGETRIKLRGVMAEYQDEDGSIVVAHIKPELVS